jgi:hypothetical protein
MKKNQRSAGWIRNPESVMNRIVICGDHSLVCLNVKDGFGTVVIKENKIRMFCLLHISQIRIKIEIKIVCAGVKDIYGAEVPWQPR